MSVTLPSVADAALSRTRLYRPARNLFQRLLNRDYYADRRYAQAFLRMFVEPGAIVFDIGANRGLMSEIFLEIGAARVVAVEPHPRLAQQVRQHYGCSRLTVVEAAIGREPGTATLQLGRDHIYSTISDDWMQLVRAHPDWPDRWDGEVPVEVTTLDALMGEHGVPDFMKIDVEGFEDAVLSTLPVAVPALSFEFQCPNLDIAERCMDALGDLAEYRYAAARGETMQLATQWMRDVELLDVLAGERSSQPNAHGDVYARASPA